MAVPFLWRQAISLSEFYREIAKGQKDPFKKSILNLASIALEELSDELAAGAVREATRKKLMYIRDMMRHNNMPHYSLDKIIERVSRTAWNGVPVGSPGGIGGYEYLLGLT
ncbi:hypothetical protein [Aeropyrum camini]|uniref:Uncharacterized protein n=1 Tax=Aeropyrum camini SY1 = JCM 12091 TaxID=1198449 RepID=U3THF0_9CREN|nr:hypothetical protein [Aeropyrum camini]BAN90759.1 hypothetical protein ACAM_1290 [Aeropyrum camini SY1 = JCM 12091]